MHYSAPYFVFQAGNIGFERQPHAGRVIWVLALAGCAVVLTLGVVLAIIFGGSW